MEEMREELEFIFTDSGMTFFCQDPRIDRAKMVEEFKKAYRPVLFGLDSFWNGVDIPGPQLQTVIITKIPFPVPDEPIIQAKCEQVDQRDGSSFMEISLPYAVIRLKQGFGRLIRNSTDTGIVAILDSRIHTKRYGQTILKSLPRCRVISSPHLVT